MPRILKTKPEVILKNGKPKAVIIDIKDYQELLERLEDREDMADLGEMRKDGLQFRKFDDFLSENKNAL